MPQLLKPNSRWRYAAGAVLIIASAAQAGTVRRTIGAYQGWAVFRDDVPERCYAIAAPADLPPGARSAAFASVATWPSRRAIGQLHFRLSRGARPASAILLAIDTQVFQLVGRGPDAWARGRAVDRAVVAAMRTGIDLTVTARDERGNAFTDRYALTGAATAIDASILACAPR